MLNSNSACTPPDRDNDKPKVSNPWKPLNLKASILALKNGQNQMNSPHSAMEQPQASSNCNIAPVPVTQTNHSPNQIGSLSSGAMRVGAVGTTTSLATATQLSNVNEQVAQQSSSATCLDNEIENKWADAHTILTEYKTKPCQREANACRKGYGCPYYHNNKDKRRSPSFYTYSAAACPTVKIKHEWLDPSLCPSGKNCLFCHTRTEQQFHPEIYKSNKCHDMIQTNYCPRGYFCAFAHVFANTKGSLTRRRTVHSEGSATFKLDSRLSNLIGPIDLKNKVGSGVGNGSGTRNGNQGTESISPTSSNNPNNVAPDRDLPVDLSNETYSSKLKKRLASSPGALTRELIVHDIETTPTNHDEYEKRSIFNIGSDSHTSHQRRIHRQQSYSALLPGPQIKRHNIDPFSLLRSNANSAGNNNNHTDRGRVAFDDLSSITSSCLLDPLDSISQQMIPNNSFPIWSERHRLKYLTEITIPNRSNNATHNSQTDSEQNALNIDLKKGLEEQNVVVSPNDRINRSLDGPIRPILRPKPSLANINISSNLDLDVLEKFDLAVAENNCNDKHEQSLSVRSLNDRRHSSVGKLSGTNLSETSSVHSRISDRDQNCSSQHNTQEPTLVESLNAQKIRSHSANMELPSVSLPEERSSGSQINLSLGNILENGDKNEKSMYESISNTEIVKIYLKKKNSLAQIEKEILNRFLCGNNYAVPAHSNVANTPSIPVSPLSNRERPDRILSLPRTQQNSGVTSIINGRISNTRSSGNSPTIDLELRRQTSPDKVHSPRPANLELERRKSLREAQRNRDRLERLSEGQLQTESIVKSRDVSYSPTPNNYSSGLRFSDPGALALSPSHSSSVNSSPYTNCRRELIDRDISREASGASLSSSSTLRGDRVSLDNTLNQMRVGFKRRESGREWEGLYDDREK